MSIDLDSIQEMWEKDAKIDRDNLHEESLNIPSLHAKYFELYNTIFLLRKKAEQQRKNIRHERYEYFSGKADPEVYVENPFGKKIRDKDTMTKYLDADEKLSNSSLNLCDDSFKPFISVAASSLCGGYSIARFFFVLG